MLTKENLKAIRADLEVAFAEVAKKNGLAKLHIGNITFDPSGSFAAKLEGTVAGGLSKDALRYNEMRSYTNGLPELGATLIMGGRGPHKVEGCNTTGSKIILSDAQGKQWLFTADAVKQRALIQKLPVSKPFGDEVFAGAQS